eukprot:PhF_6_TR16924/c3_g1_i6/m.25444
MYGFTDVKREFEFYQTLQHPNILTILEVSNNNHYLVSKYFARNLQQQSFCPKLFQRIIRDVLQGVHHLHTHGYIHNNIKPNKIFLDDTVVVLGGLYSVTKVGHTGPVPHTLEYMSPSTCLGEPPQRSNDLWALGMTMLYMVYGGCPWRKADGLKRTDIEFELTRSVHPPIPRECGLTTLGVDFVELLFQANSDPRITTESLMRHPFLFEE